MESERKLAEFSLRRLAFEPQWPASPSSSSASLTPGTAREEELGTERAHDVHSSSSDSANGQDLSDDHHHNHVNALKPMAYPFPSLRRAGAYGWHPLPGILS